MRLALLLILTAAAAQAQPDAFAGRWIALRVVGDAAATRDLEAGRLEKVLVVNPGGHVILRGTDHVHGQGAGTVFTGRLFGDAVRFSDLPGIARLALTDRRLTLTDPAGQQTRFIRLGPPPAF